MTRGDLLCPGERGRVSAPRIGSASNFAYPRGALTRPRSPGSPTREKKIG